MLNVMVQKKWLFYRDYSYFTGGQGKVADYYMHITSRSEYLAEVFFSPESCLDVESPWLRFGYRKAHTYSPNNYDYIFLAGMDWNMYLGAKRDKIYQPVINLIQHVRHADPAEPLYRFLSEPAIRICVSHEVKKAILDTGLVNGPVFVVENGIDFPLVSNEPKSSDVYIMGLKNPLLGVELNRELGQRGLSVVFHNQRLARDKVLIAMHQARIGVLMPHKTEGFFLPGLEAMYYCDLAIIPDCIGNRGYCMHGENCLVPKTNSIDGLLESITEAQGILQNFVHAQALKQRALETAKSFSKDRERNSFLGIVNNIDAIWRQHFA